MNYVASNGDMMRELSAQFLTLAEKQGATVPLMVGHRITGTSLCTTGEVAASWPHLDRAIALYDPLAHRPFATRFGQDLRVSALAFRSLTSWLLGYPEAALADADQAVKDAREVGQAATLMYAVGIASITYAWCRNYTAASMLVDELIAVAAEKGAMFWKASGMVLRGCIFASTDKAPDAIRIITAGDTVFQPIRGRSLLTWYVPHLAKAHADLGQFDDAWRFINEVRRVVETANVRFCETEVHRIAGEIALRSPQRDAAKGEAYFERALTVARAQQAKSWELRAAMSMTRLWRDQGKRDEARDLLAPVYGWFTEGFDTRDLKEAKALLDEVAV